MNKREGFSTPPLLLIIFSLCVMLLAIATVINSRNQKLKAYKKYYEKKDEAECILENVLENFQVLKDEKVDNERSFGIQSVLEKNNEYSLCVKDISTGINKRFLDKKIIENEEIQKLCDFYVEDIITDYSWCNKNVCGDAVVKKIQNEFEENDVGIFFPLVNELSLFNVYNMSEPFIFAILKLCDIPNAKEKANELYTKCLYEDIDKKEIAKVLEVSESNIVTNYLGCKTTFWKVYFETEFFIVQAVIAGVPYKKEKVTEIEKYILIEKEIIEKGREIAKD